jgi:1,2-phenylacetyl-CoA epoxidase catalytic subunit
MSVDKMLDEERHHAHHGRGWFRTIGRRGGRDAQALGDATGRALATVAVWLGPADDPGDRALVAAGIRRQSACDVSTALAGDVRELAAETDIEVPIPAPAVFKGWNPRTRRAAENGGPADDILFHLRGDANALFKVGE